PLEDAFASSYFFLVRPDQRVVRPRYLAWAINVPLRSQVTTLMQGTHVPQVSIADFGELPVDLPPLGVQDQIVPLDDFGRREGGPRRSPAGGRSWSGWPAFGLRDGSRKE